MRNTMVNKILGDMKEVRQIDLHLPRGWNDCTTRELEQISAAMMLNTQQATRLRPFDWAKVKVDVVLSVNNLQVLGENLFRQRTRKFFRKQAPFAITTGQMMDLCSRLDWIDAPQDKQQPLYRFPYPTLRLDWLHEYHGPDVMLDGYTWTEYRHLQDWMQAYMAASNRLLRVQRDGRATILDHRQAMQAVDDARSHFLAVLFRAKMALSDGDRAARPFRDFDPIKWQVILLWWSSLMQQLMVKFPRVFKAQPVKGRHRQKQQSPWDFYNHVTATLADEYKTSETDQAQETYSVTLQKLENMAARAAEMEKLSHKK